VRGSRLLSRAALAVVLAVYTVYQLGPFVWVAAMSLRTTNEIHKDHYALPVNPRWSNYVDAWTTSNYHVYFWNSALVVVASVALLVVVGTTAAHCLARYRFPGNRLILIVIFSTILLPPQITLISLFQVLVEYGLFDSRLGLILVYVGTQVPLTVYLLEAFFARIPQDLFDAAKIDGYSEFEIFWRIALPIATPAVVTAVIVNFVLLWNEFLYAVVLISDDSRRTLPLGIQKFMGDQFSDVAMIAAGAMISIVPVILLYALFSEKVIQGMTAGAVK
jgi:multiple sugar transport system permease protein/raffinose/stachyose/melibiose transport system permease protein